MIEEARLEPVASGLTPVTAGWFVVNARDATWLSNDATQACCIFESDDFVLRGSAGSHRVRQARRGIRPPRAPARAAGRHVPRGVGAGGLPRPDNDDTFWRVYKRSHVALRYGASVEMDTTSDAEANASLRGRWRHERPESWSELPWSSAS